MYLNNRHCLQNCPIYLKLIKTKNIKNFKKASLLQCRNYCLQSNEYFQHKNNQMPKPSRRKLANLTDFNLMIEKFINIQDKLGVVAHACNPSTWKVKAKEPEVPIHLQLQSKFETSQPQHQSEQATATSK